MDMKTWRTEEGLTQAEAGARLKRPVSAWEWNRWERGIVQPGLDRALEIVEATNGRVTIPEMLKKAATVAAPEQDPTESR